MSVSAHDVARELRARLPEGTGRAKVQKLLYYCQGWHLAHYGEPMFDERIEAWKEGPVVARLWADEEHARSTPRPQDVGASHLDVLEYVLERYGSETGAQLIDRTHAEAPWKSIADSAGWAPAKPSATIEHEALRASFAADLAGDRVHQVVIRHPMPPSDLVRDQVAALQRGERVQAL